MRMTRTMQILAGSTGLLLAATIAPAFALDQLVDVTGKVTPSSLCGAATIFRVSTAMMSRSATCLPICSSRTPS